MFVSDLIKSAKKDITLIDNYVDETVLTMLDKRNVGVNATIYMKEFNKAHDRFLIIDNQVYHIGASMKDLGKKWFAFSLIKDLTPTELIAKI